MAKGQTSRAAKKPGTRKPQPKKTSRELIITLNTSNGEIEKIEELGVAGKRRAFSEAEFAKLVGDDGLEEVCEALEAAYMAGIQDGFDESDDVLAGAPHQHEDVQESLGEEVLRSGIRRIIFRRAVRRKLERAGQHAGDNGGHAAR